MTNTQPGKWRWETVNTAGPVSQTPRGIPASPKTRGTGSHLTESNLEVLKTAKFWIWGGIAAIRIRILLFGAGCTATVTAPYYPYGEPRGAGVSWAGVAAVAVGIGMIAPAAITKALGAGTAKEHHSDS